MSTVQLITPRRFNDDRGWFCETYNERTFAQLGLTDRYVQDNHSLSLQKGVIRGLHFQTPPRAQAKLVRCIRGAVFDVAVDVRADSPTFGRWVGTTLTAENGHQLYIPVGFAHGFLTLEDGCEVVYKVTDFYAPENDSGLAWNDPDIAVDWPKVGAQPLLSKKDLGLGPLAAFRSPFAYDGVPLAPLE